MKTPAHQLAHLESPNFYVVLSHHEHDASAARRAAALGEQLVYATAQNQSLNVWRSVLAAVRVIARSGDFKYRAQQINRFLSTKLID
jgi:hypothetical protein